MDVLTNFKPPKCVSPAIRNFARGQTCTLRMPWCVGGTETTVHCHVRQEGFNGIGMKPLDFFGYHGCRECHRREGEAGKGEILRAMMETQTRLYAAGIIRIGEET